MGTTSKHLIENQIPYHIRESSPLFTKFLQYYYEFVDQSKITDIIQDIKKYNDIDQVDEDFIKSFFEEFRSLPKKIATDERFIAKHIYELYQSKGSEQSIKLLFKIVYGDRVNIRYPQEYILRASDGRWTQSKFVVISFPTPLTTFEGNIGTTLEFSNDQGSFTIQVTAIDWISSTKLRVYFKSLNSVTVYPQQELTLVDPMSTTVVGSATSDFSKLTIIDPGSGWKRGQTLIIPGTYRDTIARVVSIGANGALDKIEIIEYGWDHNTNTTLVINTPLYNAVLGFTTAYVTTARGYYEADAGQLSNAEIRLQDNKFYQQYSYVIDTNIGIESFKDIIKLVHPAGTRYFSQLIKTAEIDMRPYINAQYTQSVGTVYAQDVVETDDAWNLDVTKIAADTQATSDLITSKNIIAPKADSSVISEADAKHVTKVTADASTITEADAKIVIKIATDDSTATDAVTSKTITSVSNDTATTSETDDISVTKVLVDSATSSESDTKDITAALFDSATTDDNAVKTTTISKADTSIVADATAATFSTTLQDSTTGSTDIISRFDATVAANDVNTATDIITHKTLAVTLADTAGTSDTVNISGNINTTVFDDVTVADSIVTAVNYIITLSDDVGASDALSISQTKYSSDSVTSTDGTPVSTYVVYQSEDYFAEAYVYPETIINIS